MTKNYKITFSEDKDDFSFKTETEFLEWAFSNKDILENGSFSFESKIDNIDGQRIEKVLAFLKYYISIKRKCNVFMNDYNRSLLGGNYNEEVQKAIEEFVRVNDNGKFLRAALIGLGYKAFCDDDSFLDLAMAIEVFQTSILIHDDIIDKATIRRGMDTIEEAYNKYYNQLDSDDFVIKRNSVSSSMALCTGDLGFYLAEEIIVNGYKNNKNLSDILSYYHQMVIKTCYGEMIDVMLPFKEEFFGTDINLEEKIMEIYKLKTAWYTVIGPYCLGLTLAGADKSRVSEMEKILLDVGVAFQIKDDLLGIYGDDKHLGKSTNSDIEEYKQTILYSYVMKTKHKDELLKYYGKPNLTISEINEVKNIFDKSGSRNYAEKIMIDLFESSLKAIEKISWLNEKSKHVLLGFIIYLQNRTK